MVPNVLSTDTTGRAIVNLVFFLVEDAFQSSSLVA